MSLVCHNLIALNLQGYLDTDKAFPIVYGYNVHENCPRSEAMAAGSLRLYASLKLSRPLRYSKRPPRAGHSLKVAGLFFNWKTRRGE